MPTVNYREVVLTEKRGGKGELSKRGVVSNTIKVVTGDVCDALMAAGERKSLKDDRSLSGTCLQVPLILPRVSVGQE
jgi:hypothetical protein